MNIKRFDTYRGVAVDKNGTKGDVAVGLVDVKYVWKPSEGTEAYELYKRIEKGEVIGVVFYYTREISGMDAIIQAALVTTADFERMITTTKGCRFVGNKIYGLPMGNEVFSLEGAHLSKLGMC